MTNAVPPVGTLFIDSRDGAINRVLFYDDEDDSYACERTRVDGSSSRGSWEWCCSKRLLRERLADFTYIEVDRETYDVIADMYLGD